MQHDAPIFPQLDASERGLGPGAEVFLHAAKAYAIAFARVPALKLRLPLGTLQPHLMLRCLFQHFIGTNGPGRDSALGIFHAGFEYVAQTELDRVDLQLGSQFIHHHLGSGHALQRAVATSRSGINGARSQPHRRQIAFREVVNRLCRRRRYHHHRRRKVAATTAVCRHLAVE
ncbi:hypothetical protein D3C73_827750 [compost metagenome]